MDETRVVVPLIQVLEHRREYLGLLVGQGEPFGLGVHVLVPERGLEEGRMAEDVLMRRKNSLLLANDQSDDGGCQVAFGRGR